MTGDIARMVQELYDRQAILDVINTYSRGVDRLDRDLIVSVFHPDALDDHGVFIGSREEFADWAIANHSATHQSHQHCIFNHTCDLDGDVAHTETYYMFVAMNRAGTRVGNSAAEPLASSGGRYIDRLEKRDGRWAISVRVCLREWAPLKEVVEPLDQSRLTVVQNQPEAIRALMRDGPQPARDHGDLSYQRPLTIPEGRLRAYREQVAKTVGPLRV